MSYFYFFILVLISHASNLYAADINIQLSQKSVDNKITLSITNGSSQALKIAKIRLRLNKKNYWINKQDTIQANTTKQYKLTIDYPRIVGSYAQISTVFYFNEGKLFSISDAGYFNYQRVKQFNSDAKLSSKQKDEQTFLTLSVKKPQLWSLYIPDEVSLKPLPKQDNKHFLLVGKYTGFNSNYPIFAVKETIINQQHFTQIISIHAKVKHGNAIPKLNYKRGQTPTILLIIICIISILFFIIIKLKFKLYNNFSIFLLFFSRLFFLSLSYLFLKNASELFSFSSLLSEHFSGKNYRYFFVYFIDAYYWLFIILYPPYIKYLTNNRSINGDKYIAALFSLIKSSITKENKVNISRNHLQSPTKTGWLILAVKVFFLPLIASWVIGNIIHQYNLIQNFNWNFHQINAFLLALLILVDTSIFLVGYMFESEKLGSKIRSVEPTILGWVVCLWCYPPFNSFSFAPFDIDLISIHIPISSWAEPIVLGLITLLWGIFVWASISMGFKASNLTNRGIVSKGPYRYCRHPAYTAKVLVWLVEAVFLGKYFIGLFISFLIIYGLRALTEERHLSMDKDYLEYKKKVPYHFIPRIF